MSHTDDFPLLDITGLSNQGQGIARLSQGPESGLVVFVPGALPGERVRAKIRERTKNYLVADIVEEIASLGPADCPHVSLCGGCALARLPYSEQLIWKRDFVRQAMLRTAHLGADELETQLADIEASPETTCYRNKMTFAFGDDQQGNLILGQRSPHSHSIVPTPQCARMPDIVQSICQCCTDFARTQHLEAYRQGVGQGLLRFLVVRQGFLLESHEQGLWLLLLSSPSEKQVRRKIVRLAEELLAAFPEIACFVHEERKSRDAFAIGEKRIFVLGQAQDARLALPLADRFFNLDTASFFQVNTSASQKLVHVVQNLLLPSAGRDRHLLDLFCGVGAPGLLYAKHFADVQAIEVQKASAIQAEMNARAFGMTNYHARAGACQKLVQSVANADVLLCDPPRTGLEPLTLSHLLSRDDLRSICYISCNPVTLARDVRLLSKRFAVSTIVPVDLFPHTPHVESVVLMSRCS